MKDSYINQYFIGDCKPILDDNIPDDSIDCVVTSPPYAEQRNSQYGGIPEKEYPEWTVSYMRGISRVLKDSGSVAIVIRPHLYKGEISDYVLRTRLALRDDGWKETEELIWIKPDSPPMGSYYRPRRAWESILWFSKSKNPYCDTKINGVESDRIGMESTKGTGDYIHAVSKSRKGAARSKDYFSIGTSKNNRDKDNNHPAQFPEELASWLINMLSPPDGVVLDPFLGSGTTAVAALNSGRKFVGIEKMPEYEHIIKKRIELVYADD